MVELHRWNANPRCWVMTTSALVFSLRRILEPNFDAIHTGKNWKRIWVWVPPMKSSIRYMPTPCEVVPPTEISTSTPCEDPARHVDPPPHLNNFLENELKETLWWEKKLFLWLTCKRCVYFHYRLCFLGGRGPWLLYRTFPLRPPFPSRAFGVFSQNKRRRDEVNNLPSRLVLVVNTAD